MRIQRGCRGRGGLTLLELMSALVIIGILASLAGPKLSGWLLRWRMTTLLDRFQTELWYARSLAARTGFRTELRFVPAEAGACVERYRIVRVGPSESVVREIIVADEGRKLCMRQNRDLPIRIDGRGIPAPSAARSVWVQSGGMVDSLTLSVLGGVSRRP